MPCIVYVFIILIPPHLYAYGFGTQMDMVAFHQCLWMPGMMPTSVPAFSTSAVLAVSGTSAALTSELRSDHTRFIDCILASGQALQIHRPPIGPLSQSKNLPTSGEDGEGNISLL